MRRSSWWCAVLFGAAASATGGLVAAQEASVGLGTFWANQETQAPVFGSSNDNVLLDVIFQNVLDRSYPSVAVRWGGSQNIGAAQSIAVCWEDLATSTEDDRLIVQRAATESWQAHSGLTFVGWGECQSNTRGIRIVVEDGGADRGPRTLGLGNQLDGQAGGMRLNFTFQTWSPTCAQSEQVRQWCIFTIAVHEFGHAIGFAHEQNRPDTPGECRKAPQGGDGDLLLTPWDPRSVMNYCNEEYNNNGVLSEFDIFGVAYLYGERTQ